MKTLILSLILISTLVACKKETIAPVATPGKPAGTSTTASSSTTSTTSTSTTSTPVTPVAAATDTIPEMAGFKLKLIEDNTNYDEVLFMFKQKSSTTYDAMEDGKYFTGNGQVSLASISSDGTDLAVNSLPYSPGMSIGLDANAKTDGTYTFDLSFQIKIPYDVHIWLKDNLLNNSVDLRITDYTFKVSKADPNSFGNKRFELIIKR
ncbi:hypothetical protein [Mucilaginibacter ginsenosidivorans]|uniref:Lipoprotein n=1 Tax=Mucilaginibacter ginsenosidivorans TaxID=398053 RepID=A0A5B8US36_9SPHI|nr:hypothetical protein [Mucilaginibacter ginsenosidivorans]QEC61834.1 hypothetical protein FRZ54_04280 [Mucilaginibacter ginsenosidivorans]